MTGRGNWVVAISLALLSLFLTVSFSAEEAEAQTKAQVPGVPSPMPESFGVMPFENRSGILGLEWMRLAVPFVLAERVEGFARLRPGYGELVVEKAPAHRDRVSIAEVEAFAKEHRLDWVLGGWVRRPDWKLELGVSLYRVRNGNAVLAAETVGLGDFKQVHALIGAAILEVAEKAGLRDPNDNLALVNRESSKDFYAFTLFGRALGGMLAATTSAEREKAGQGMQRAVFIEPTFWEAQRLFAFEQRRLAKPVLAMVRLETILAARPSYAAALDAYGRSAHARSQTRLATETMEKVVELRPWQHEARYELGMLYWEQGLGEEAFAQFTIVVRAAPKHIRARRALALIHAKRSDTANLVDELRAVAKLAPNDVETQLELGAALVAADSIEDAIDVYKGVTVLDPKHVQALKFLGDLYRQQKQPQRAIRSYGLAMQAAPNDPRSYFLLGAVYVQLGQDAAARRIYLKAQKFPKWKGEAFNNLGAIALREDRIAQGVWYLRRAVQKEGRRATYRHNLALALSKTQAADEALVHIDAALGLDGGRAESHYLRGVILLRLGRAEEARQAFTKTLSLDAGHADASHNLALLDAMKQRAIQGEVAAEGAP